MKQTSNTRVVVGAVAVAGALLLGGAVLAATLVRAPVEAGATPPGVDEGVSAEVTGGGAGESSPGGAPSDGAPQAGSDPFAAAVTEPSGALSSQLLVLAAERAPFDPEREAPAGRYLFPEERVVEGPPPEPPRPPDPPFRVVGAIAAGNQSIAVVEPQGQAPKVLRVGEDLLGFRVKSVEGDVVVVSGQGWDLSLPVEALQPVRMAANARSSRRAVEVIRGADRARERALEAVRERLGELSRQMQEAGQGPVRMEVQGDRAIIMGPNGQWQEIQIPGGGEGQRETIRVVPGQRIQVRPGGGQ